mgnify:FL=1
MIDDVKNLVKAATGYEVTDDDAPFLSYLSENIRKEILTDINQEELPDSLSGFWDRRTAAAFLRVRCQDVLGSKNLNMVNRITEGKVTVQLTGSTPEERMKSLIGIWESGGGLLACFRKIRW